MLDMGFLPAIQRILAVVPQQRQTLCFSATLEKSVASLVSRYMRDAVRIALGSTLKPVESVELQAFELTGMQKPDVLRQLLNTEKGRTLVFARTKRGTERLTKQLARDGYAAAMIHGDRTQAQRTAALNSFEEGRIDVLVATDLAARGLDVQELPTSLTTIFRICRKISFTASGGRDEWALVVWLQPWFPAPRYSSCALSNARSSFTSSDKRLRRLTQLFHRRATLFRRVR